MENKSKTPSYPPNPPYTTAATDFDPKATLPTGWKPFDPRGKVPPGTPVVVVPR